jgi:hypothetical protein
MAQLNFDASQVAPDAGFEPVPAGWYKVLIDESEMKPTKAGDGAYLHCRFNILEGQYAGRKLFARLNLRNANPTAQEIGFKQLSAIAHAVGVLQVADSTQLHNIPLQVRVKIRKDKDGEYDDQNDITSYKNINEQVGATAAAPGGAPAAFAPPAAGAPPAGWTPPAAAAPPPPAAAAPPPPPAPLAPPPPPAPPVWKGPPGSTQAQYAAAGWTVEQMVTAGFLPATAPPAPWTPPAGGQPWAAQPPAATAAAPAAPATPPSPPHPAQAATPPWQKPA